MRIKFRQVKDSIYESYHTYKHPTNGAEYKVVLDRAAHSYQIVNVHIDFPEAVATKINHSTLLRSLKSDFAKLGVFLEKDVRKKRK